MVMPFLYMLGASFKFNNEIYELSLLPREPTLDTTPPVRAFGLRALVRNSLLIGTVTTARCCSSTASLAAGGSGSAGAISCS
jgi:multiple sugar transport system permease protein